MSVRDGRIFHESEKYEVIDPLQGLGFYQTLQCLAPSIGGLCLGASGTDPSTAFRIGID